MENVLLDSTHTRLKIIDLGLGTFYAKQDALSTFCGSPDYAAPELFMRKLYSGPAVDIWAMVCCRSFLVFF
jgi:serine/threonine protein kinase